jgi:hypothetical protein
MMYVLNGLDLSNILYICICRFYFSLSGFKYGPLCGSSCSHLQNTLNV